MRIAVVTSYFPTNVQPYRGHSAYQLLRQMPDGADIRVFCPLTRYPRWLLPRNFPYARVNLKHQFEDLDAEYFEYPALPVVSRSFNPSICERYLHARVRAFEPDLILNYFVYPEGCAAVSLGERLGIPVVLGVIGSDVNRIPDRVTEWHTRRALRRAAGVIAVSDQTRRRAVALGGSAEKAKTIVNGCDLDIFRPLNQRVARQQISVSGDAELVVFVGWISPTKGVLELADAIAHLNQKRRNLMLALIGEGALAAEIKARDRKSVV